MRDLLCWLLCSCCYVRVSFLLQEHRPDFTASCRRWRPFGLTPHRPMDVYPIGLHVESNLPQIRTAPANRIICDRNETLGGTKFPIALRKEICSAGSNYSYWVAWCGMHPSKAQTERERSRAAPQRAATTGGSGKFAVPVVNLGVGGFPGRHQANLLRRM
jgi:hypothetical protein